LKFLFIFIENNCLRAKNLINHYLLTLHTWVIRAVTYHSKLRLNNRCLGIDLSDSRSSILLWVLWIPCSANATCAPVLFTFVHIEWRHQWLRDVVSESLVRAGRLPLYEVPCPLEVMLTYTFIINSHLSFKVSFLNYLKLKLIWLSKPSWRTIILSTWIAHNATFLFFFLLFLFICSFKGIFGVDFSFGTTISAIYYIFMFVGCKSTCRKSVWFACYWLTVLWRFIWFKLADC